jgi:nucleoside-diphosphate-sugar epimerase
MHLPQRKITMCIAVTGTSGYVGSVICKELEKRFNVVHLVRCPTTSNSAYWSFESSDNELMQLTQYLTDRKATHLIHIAWPMTNLERSCENSLAVMGSERLFNAANKAGIKNIIFISSISSFKSAISLYGQQKYIVEQLVARLGGISLRLGLVYGKNPGGAFSKILKSAKRSKLVPLIGMGDLPQYMLQDSALAEAILQIIYNYNAISNSEPITLAEPSPIKFRDLLLMIARHYGKKLILIPIPWRVIYYTLYAFEIMNITLDFKSDSVLSFVFQNRHINFEPLKQLKIHQIVFSPEVSM